MKANQIHRNRMYVNKMVWNTVAYTYAYCGESGTHLQQGIDQTHFHLTAENQVLSYDGVVHHECDPIVQNASGMQTQEKDTTNSQIQPDR